MARDILYVVPDQYFLSSEHRLLVLIQRTFEFCCSSCIRLTMQLGWGPTLIEGPRGGISCRKDPSAQSHSQARSDPGPAPEGGFKPRGGGGPRTHHVRRTEIEHCSGFSTRSWFPIAGLYEYIHQIDICASSHCLTSLTAINLQVLQCSPSIMRLVW